ncbi:unnamed protein product [Acanthoscelides obtectus]|uniref:DH domain-containing protein n=1 Tax=Acanthoscelides obtectus TaxID=200917 RepID=A0A9P0JWP4_ACAOB|nr:unnamed protein product [Acanthoscelides obtectus]CAK1653055.1 Pleckstrin homology domain-containing family G member 4B [Acanthoscelides obtectus]
MHSLRRSCSLESLQTLGNDETDVAGVSNRTRWINDGSENGPQAAASMDLQQNTNDDKGRRFVRKNSKTYSKSWRGRQPKCLQEKHKYFTVSQGNTSSVTEAVKEYEARYLKDLDTDAARQEREYIEAFDAMIQAKQEEVQEDFDDRLDFSAYLLTPLQRLGKYILFLENIQNQFEALGIPVDITKAALEIVKREMTKGNDFVAIESIYNSPISRLDYGTFVMRENFTIIKPRKMEVMVFLFKNIIVFTNADQKEMETFYYLDSIKTNDLRIATFDDLTLHLTDFTKSKRKNRSIKYSYVLEAKSDKIKKLWKKTIEDILWQQLYMAKETVKAMPSVQASTLEYGTKKDRKRRSKRGLSAIFYAD